LDDFLGGVNGTVVQVKALGDAAFVEGGAKGFNEGVHVFGEEELAVAANAAGIVDKGDETGLDRGALYGDVRAVEGVALGC
jgi:hypothetical protein